MKRNKILDNYVSESRLSDEQLREHLEASLEARGGKERLTGIAAGKAEAERRFGKNTSGGRD